jgi:glutamyl-tRNA reductase
MSYKDAAVDVRERSLLTAAQQDAFLREAVADRLPAISELAILSTCNRTEVYAIGTTDDAESHLIATWAAQIGVPAADLAARVWILRDDACVRHVFEVSAGLDSQVIGEPQILGQVADAYERARSQGAVGVSLSALFQRAIQAGKRVRAETALGQGMLSMSSVAAAHSGHIFGDLAKATVLIIGTGEMARSAIAALMRQ